MSSFSKKYATQLGDFHSTEQQLSLFDALNCVMLLSMRDLRKTNGIQDSLWFISEWYHVVNATYRRSIESFRVDRWMESSRDVLGAMDARNDLPVINHPLICQPGRFGLITGTKTTASEMEMWRYAIHSIER